MTECVGLDGLEPIFLSISETARITSDSPWRVKELLREGVYKAKKSGRRTLITFASIRTRCDALPAAISAPARRAPKTGAKKASRVEVGAEP
jgi:hypothetical protein